MKTALKNFLLLKLTCLLQSQRKKTFHSEEPRFLIVSTTALGDTLWATPLLRALKKRYPTAYVGVLTSSIGKEVLENNPHINELFLLKEPLFWHFWPLLHRLKKVNFQAVLFLHASQRLTLPLVKLLNTEYLIGSQGHGKGLAKLFTHEVESQDHEITRRLKIGALLDIKPDNLDLDFYFKPLNSLLIPPKPYIIFHPGSKDTFKRWPLEYYIQLGQKLSKNFTIVLIGVPKEKDLLKKIALQIEKSLIFCHSPSLQKTATLLSHAELIIANDSGPLHLASALKKPALTFFVTTDPKICGPLYHPCTILEAPLTCHPCLKRKCLKATCFYQIKPEIAYIKSLELLNLKPETETVL